MAGFYTRPWMQFRFPLLGFISAAILCRVISSFQLHRLTLPPAGSSDQEQSGSTWGLSLIFPACKLWRTLYGPSLGIERVVWR